MRREQLTSKSSSDQGTKTQEYFVYFKFRVPIKAPALMGRGGAAEGASFRDASRKRDDPELAPTKRRDGVNLPSGAEVVLISVYQACMASLKYAA